MTEEQKYTAKQIANLIPLPGYRDHKYSRGMLVVVGGCECFSGAACLASYAGQRMGAGYTVAYVAEQAAALVRNTSPSLVVRPWQDLNPESMKPSLPDRPVAYALGCGLDPSADETEHITRLVLEQAQAPVVVDGGALHVLGAPRMREILLQRQACGLGTVITPHVGEAAVLAAAFEAPLDDMADLSRLLAHYYHCVCLLKGPLSYVSDGAEVYTMDEGSPALAKAGTGDVLAGMVGALLAQGLAAADAAYVAAVLHAHAGRAAANHLSEVCVLAEDVIEALPLVITDFLEEA